MEETIGRRIAALRSHSTQSYASRSEAAYDILRTAVMERLLQPGQRLREVDVSAWLDMSRTPVREAFRRLERDGLITFAPHRGMTVTELDHGAVTELYRMREVLEGTAASLAAQHATEAEIAENLAKTGNAPVVSEPAAFAAFVRAEIAKWAKVIRESGIEKID